MTYTTQQIGVPWSELGTFAHGDSSFDVSESFQYVITDLLITPSSDAGAGYFALATEEGAALLLVEMPTAGVTYTWSMVAVLPVASSFSTTYSGSTEAYVVIGGYALIPTSASLLAGGV